VLAVAVSTRNNCSTASCLVGLQGAKKLSSLLSFWFVDIVVESFGYLLNLFSILLILVAYFIDTGSLIHCKFSLFSLFYYLSLFRVGN